MARKYRTEAGREYPSVTTVLPEFLWGSEEAKTRGTAVHKACALLNEGNLDWESLHPLVEPYVRAYELLLLETRFQPVKWEMTVVSEKYGVAGTLDLIGKMGRDLVIADIKTGVSVNLGNWEVQVAAYEQLYREQTGERKTMKRKVFALHDDGHYRLYELNQPDAWNVFLAYLRIYKWERKWK